MPDVVRKQPLKRGFDLLVALAALVVLAPLLVLLAILVAVDSPGPVLYRDERVGLGGRSFRLLKFRTMEDGSHGMRQDLLQRHAREDHPFMLVEDPRVTRSGEWLRRASLDELPQLWNVVCGDMSLVGPRPLLPEDLQQAPRDPQDWKAVRQSVPPGITGPWQIRTRYNAGASHSAMVADDCEYVRSRSMASDVLWLLRTPAALLHAIRHG